MPYKYEAELGREAESFIVALDRAGIKGTIVPNTFRDYMVKVSIHRTGRSFGHVNLYYSPKKDRFSLKTHELRDKSIVPDLEACWNHPSSPEHTGIVAEAISLGYQIYVDGSYIDDALGYGVVVLKDGKTVTELYGPVMDNTLQGMRQVGGELQAVYESLSWCQANGVQEVSIFYDYVGIEKWATGGWNAKKPATRAYAKSLQDCPVTVHWHKVESHSGDRWNDHADQLAKLGARQGKSREEDGRDPLVELREKVNAFVEFLNQCGIAASFRGILNNQFARIIVLPKRGLVDLYNTRKRPLSKPYLHGFPDPAVQAKIKGLWQGFLSESAKDKAQVGDFLDETTHYYEILQPYSDCEFDFIDLALTLERACKRQGFSRLNVESGRYDFQKLEAIYFELKGGKEAS